MEATLESLVERGLGRVVSVGTRHSADHVVRVMARADVSCALVVEDHVVVGIITERDLVRRVLYENRKPFTLLAEAIMSCPVHPVACDMTVPDALRHMALHHTRRLVVLAGPKPVGVLSQRDLWASVARDLDRQVDDLTDYMYGHPSSHPPPLPPYEAPPMPRMDSRRSMPF